MSRRRPAALILAASLWFAGPAEAEPAVDLELVLAVDASGSIDHGELALQMDGIAAAFRDPEVVEAIQSGPLGRIAVTVVQWAEANYPKAAMPWVVLDDAQSAAAFADQVSGFGRQVSGGGTGIGKAVIFGLQQIARNGIAGTRRTIDLSGDGKETAFREYSVPVDQARAAAYARGVTVNGLAILSEEPDLDGYFRSRLITGQGAFVIAAAGFEDFAGAIRTKLLREIKNESLVSQIPAEPSARRQTASRPVWPTFQGPK